MLCDYRTELFLELPGLGKKCEQRITECLTELLLEFDSVIWVEELPNRNRFGINSVIFLWKENLQDFNLFRSVACCCGLCLPNIIIAKANAKENLGEFVCLSITKESELKSPDFHL